MSGARPRRTVSLRLRVVASVVAVAAAGLLLAGSVTFLLLRDAHLRDLDRRLLAGVEAARASSTSVGQPDGAATAVEPVLDVGGAVRTVLSGAVPGRYQSSVGIIDGRAAYVPSVAVAFRLDADPELVTRWAAEAADGVVLGTTVGPAQVLRYVAAPIEVVGDPARGVYVTAFDVDAELGEIASGFRTFALIAASTLVAVAAAAWFVAGQALRPIRRLRDAATGISGTDLSLRLPVTGRDDVSDLTRTMNSMFDRIEDSSTRQRRLLADIRHDLATPITIMQGHLAVVDADDPADVRSTHEVVADELGRMSDLVQDLQSLSGVDLARDRRIVDVGELSRQVFVKVSALTSHVWRYGGSAAATVEVDPARITQAWLQLADNAVKYSPPGSTVTLGSTVLGDEVMCWIADRGPGIPVEAQERVFERFGRAGAGRGTAGSGLGLAIVTAIVRAHRGRVTLDSGPHGSRFGIVLPRMPAGAARGPGGDP